MPADTSQVRALAARLRASGALLGDDMKKATTLAARAIRDDAQQRAPVETGALRESIHVRVFWGLSAVVSADIRYAQFVEYGTSKMAAQPFLNPAAEAGEQVYFESAYKAALHAAQQGVG